MTNPKQIIRAMFKNRKDEPFDATPGQVEIFRSIVDDNYKRVVIRAITQYGKLISNDTPVLTQKGWTSHGELRVGDYVFGSNGKPTRVNHVMPKGFADYEVEFSNGEKIKVNGKHEWVVKWQTRNKEWLTIETKEIFKRMESCVDKRFKVLKTPVIQYPQRELKIDPYLLGAWLGDGVSSKPAFTLSSRDSVILEGIGMEPSSVNIHKTTGVILFNYYKGKFKQDLKDLELINNKHIPPCYKQSSVDERLELLAGLIDTDGYIHNEKRFSWTGQRITITCGNKKLIDDILELIRSLAMRACVIKIPPKLSSSGIQGKVPVYYISFSPSYFIPTRLERKKVTVVRPQRYITIKSIRKTKPVEGNCISVSNEDGIYLVGKRLVVTHNSDITAMAINFLCASTSKKILLVAPRKEQARIIMDYVIQHIFDNPGFIKNVEIEGSLDRFKRERSKNRIDWKTGARIKLLTADVRTVSKEAKGLMGFGADIIICLPATEKVDTNKGRVSIGDIVNDKMDVKVASFNHKTNKIEYKKIEKYERNKGRNLLEIKIGNRIIRCTEDHPIFVVGRGYKKAKNITPGDNVWVMD